MVISRFRDRATRVEWRHRIEDHDGDLGAEGGIERGLKLTEGLGLDSAYVESTEGILPATRFAVDAYVHFVRDKTPLEAIASSLTELFAPNLHEERISGMLAHYDFVNPDIMSYFSRRMEQAPRDANFALDYVKTHAKTPAERGRGGLSAREGRLGRGGSRGPLPGRAGGGCGGGGRRCWVAGRRGRGGVHGRAGGVPGRVAPLAHACHLTDHDGGLHIRLYV